MEGVALHFWLLSPHDPLVREHGLWVLALSTINAMVMHLGEPFIVPPRACVILVFDVAFLCVHFPSF